MSEQEAIYEIIRFAASKRMEESGESPLESGEYVCRLLVVAGALKGEEDQ